jgi:hypothetical protein
MSSVTFYREMIAKSSPLTLLGGIKLPYRSMRASWAKVSVRVDGSIELELDQSKLAHLELKPGKHTIEAGGFGFKGARIEVETGESTQPVIVISPQHRVGVTNETPLGVLTIREESNVQNLLPYAFYRGLPTSFGNSVLNSVFISMLMSAAVFLLGVAALGAIPFGFVARSVGVGFIVLVPCIFIASIGVSAGLGGIVIGIRFLRLPPGWRNPPKTAVDGV